MSRIAGRPWCCLGAPRPYGYLRWRALDVAELVAELNRLARSGRENRTA